MYFKHITPLSLLTESVRYTLKNLIDIFTLPKYDYGVNVKAKLMKVQTEFEKNYRYDDSVEAAILKVIGNMHDKKYDVLDIEKLDRIFHLKLRIQNEIKDDTLGRADRDDFFIAVYRELYISSLPSYFSKYTLTKMLQGKYIIFITFDENEIEAIHTIVCENQFDATSEIELCELKIDKAIFQKS